MNLQDIRKTLCEHDSYETAPGKTLALTDRIFGRFDFWYYLKIFLVVLHGHLVAGRGRFNRKAWMDRAWAILAAVENCGGKVCISGLNNLKSLEGPVVYIANHMSILETMLLPGGIILPYQDVTIVVKKSLLTYPFFGRIMRSLDPISVNRQNPREDFKQVMTKGLDCLCHGRSVLVFPQATRSVEFHPEEFNTLGVKLAERADVPVVPVALKTDFQRVGRIFRDIGRLDRSKTVYFKFGESLTVDKSSKEIHEKVLQFIVNNLKKWGGEVRGRGQRSGVRGQRSEVGGQGQESEDRI